MVLAINKDIITGICYTLVYPVDNTYSPSHGPGCSTYTVTWIDIKCLGYTTLRVCLPMSVTVIRVTTTYLLKC